MESYSAQSMYDRRNRTLILFYSNLIKEDNKIDVYEYMRCYYSIVELPEKYRKLHLKALYSARENLEKSYKSSDVKKLIK